MPSSHLTPAAAERKRLRDRVAQQNLRNKRNRRMQTLEQQVKHCQETHSSQGTDALLGTIRKLREENRVLRDQQERLQCLLSSCQEILGSGTTTIHQDKNPDIQSHGPFREPSAQLSNLNQDVDRSRPLRFPPRGISSCPSNFHASPKQVSSTVPEHGSSTEANAFDNNDIELPFQNDNDNAENGSTLSTVDCAPDHDMEQAGDLSGALLDFSAGISIPGHYPRSESSDEIGRKGTHEASQTYPSQSGLHFPYDLEESMPFLDLGLLTALDIWTGKSIGDLPRWARTPLRTSTRDDATYSPWDADLRGILEAPDTPSPLDLLFGSSQNSLANLVQRCVKIWYHGNAERLAIGWLVYHYIKWRTQPTMERFSRLPNWIKPEVEQTSSRHPGCLDLILWKKLRLNIVKNYRQYDINRFLRHYCTCLRLRWHGHDEVLVPNDVDNYAVRPDFFRRFMSEDGWGLKAEFINQYPELFEGLDAEKISLPAI